MHITPKWRSLAVLSLLTAAAAIAACSTDKALAPAPAPVPATPIKGNPQVHATWASLTEIPTAQMPGSGYGVNGFPSIPSSGTPQRRAYDNCYANLASHTYEIISDQAQGLAWDSTGGNAGGDTLLKVRLQIKYHMYAGTYNDGGVGEPDKEVRCIRLDSVIMYRKTPQGTGVGGGSVNVLDLIDHASMDASVPADTYCWGTSLSPAPHGPACDVYNAASIIVNAKFPWARNCNRHNDGGDPFTNAGWYEDTLETGGLVGPHVATYSGSPLQWRDQNGYTADDNQWQVQIWAVGTPGTGHTGAWGWWSANNYGGNNSPHERGYWAGGTTHTFHALCNRYHTDLNNGILYPGGPAARTAWRGGLAHYTSILATTGW
jgi:hypothetical protein